ncbi:hypothetical protein N9S00_07015 [Luminiphilus sp.]|nr:hypothetical protein [Luminiphilus sp.]
MTNHRGKQKTDYEFKKTIRLMLPQAVIDRLARQAAKQGTTLSQVAAKKLAELQD